MYFFHKETMETTNEEDRANNGFRQRKVGRNGGTFQRFISPVPDILRITCKLFLISGL